MTNYNEETENGEYVEDYTLRYEIVKVVEEEGTNYDYVIYNKKRTNVIGYPTLFKVEEELRKRNVPKSKVVFDTVIRNGNSINRYVVLDFDGNTFLTQGRNKEELSNEDKLMLNAQAMRHYYKNYDILESIETLERNLSSIRLVDVFG